MSTKLKEKISVLGLGLWGTALAEYSSRHGHDVLGWARQSEVVDSINNSKRNPKSFQNISLSFRATQSLSEALQADIIILALPSRTISEFSEFLNLPSSKLLISAMKGFEPESGLTPMDFLAAQKCHVTTGVISGPSFARDVIEGTPVAVSVGSHQLDTANKIAGLFNSQTMRLYPSSDVLGVELGGALKNIIAVAVGVAEGLKLGDSTKAALIARGLAEMTRYAVNCGAQPATLSGLSGLGDLVLTANSIQSRNYSFGILIGAGVPVEEALSRVVTTVEGFYSAKIVHTQAKVKNISMPITDALMDLFDQTVAPRQMITKLMTRPMRSE